MELAEFLTTKTDNTGGTITGGLTINNTGPIPADAGANFTTTNAAGILVHSKGGKGGNGGCSTILLYTWCDNGDNGGDAGSVVVNSNSLITVNGASEEKHGLTAISQGGAGGNGGGAFGLFASDAGAGGDGGDGGTVFVSLGINSSITTHGDRGHGVFAQSQGGDGGAGGAPDSIVALGSKGGNGGDAGNVKVDNDGLILTTGGNAHGIYALSIGAGAGSGSDSDGLVAIGGNGGGQSDGAKVIINNSGSIETRNADANGIYAQSIGGGGGDGGNAGGLFATGGRAGSGGNSNAVTVRNSGTVQTGEDRSTAIFAQSIGGGGGNGGDAIAASETISVAITEGHFATGVLAQSVGGSGGAGGDARVIQVELTSNPMDFIPLLDLTSLDTTLVFGGTGGEGGNGGDIRVSNKGDVATSGAFSHGIVAQSVGGGGGSGGSAMTFEFSNTDIVPDIPVLDEISGLTTIEMTLQGSGGAGGDGGDITLHSIGNIWTEGDFAMGLVAQSVAGGGGLAGFYNPHGITNNEIGDAMFNTFIDTDAGLSFAGSVGGAGNAGNVNVNHTGAIKTLGDGAHGLFAQSVAGQGTAGNVEITVDGTINALGDHAYGIYAQSGGASGNGNITLTINAGVVSGGTEMGAGVYISDGADNALYNHGMVTSVPGVFGRSIVASGGDESIENYGTVTGNVFLGTGTNMFNNKLDATFNTGAKVDLGVGNSLNNDGTLSPGGSGNILATDFTGNLVQTRSGVIDVDIDSASGNSDHFNVNGTADLAGLVDVNFVNPGRTVPGINTTTILTADSGITYSGLILKSQPSAVVDSRLLYPNSTEVVLNTNIDFAPSPGLNRNQRAIGEGINTIQRRGGSASLSPLVSELLWLPDVETLGNGYDQISPESYDALASTTLEATQQYTETLVKRMHSIRSYLNTTGIAPAIQQTAPYSIWIEGFRGSGDQDADNGFTGFDYTSSGGGIGLDSLLKDGLIGGISYGQSHTNIDLDYSKGEGDIDSYLFSVYGSLFSDRYYLDVAVSYGRESYDNIRQIEIGTLSETASSSHHGDLYSFYTEAGYNFERHRWIVQPFVALQYNYLEEEGYNESGAGGLDLNLAGSSTDSLASDLGLRLSRPLKKENLVFIPDISVAWRHDFDIDDRLYNASFEGFPEVSFTTESRDIDDDGVLVGVGVTVLKNSGLSMYLRYDGEMRGDFSAQKISCGLRFEF